MKEFKVRELYEKDRENEVAGVQLAGALERKLPNAGKEWAWFRLFPSRTISMDSVSKIDSFSWLVQKCLRFIFLDEKDDST
jgi:hypothetical protein